jgi:hypothetical protein
LIHDDNKNRSFSRLGIKKKTQLTDSIYILADHDINRFEGFGGWMNQSGLTSQEDTSPFVVGRDNSPTPGGEILEDDVETMT